MLLRVFRYTDVTGMTFALVRRARELVWIAIGVLCLAFMMSGNRASIQAK